MTVSESGHLAFVTGEGPNSRRLMTVDRDRNVEVLVEAKGSYASPVEVSPDGKQLSVMASDLESPSEMWIVELDTGTRRPMAPKERIACGGCWLPDDRVVLTTWRSIEHGRLMIREQRRNAEPEPLFDGTHVAFEVADKSKGDPDIWTQPKPSRASPPTGAGWRTCRTRAVVRRSESDDPLQLSELTALRPSSHFDQPEFIPMPDGERFVFVQKPEAETKIERIEFVLSWERPLER